MAIRAEQRLAFEEPEPSYLRGAQIVILRPSFYRRSGKRLLDLCIAVPIFTCALPLIAVLAVLVKLTSKGPAFYGATRLGRDGKSFRMWKLRTMVEDADKQPARWREINPGLAQIYYANYKLKDDPRITTIGRFLRKTSLDELPQLWNVIRGEMSLVAPRPIVSGEIENYGDCASLLLSVPPGITGCWQVEGRNEIEYPERADLELSYVESLSFRNDVRLLLRTVPALLKVNGV